MNRNFYKEVERYKEIKEFGQNEYIRIADISKLYAMPCVITKREEIMSERLVDSYLKGVKLRRTVCNWPEDVKAVAGGYRTHTTISHVARKDVN